MGRENIKIIPPSLGSIMRGPYAEKRLKWIEASAVAVDPSGNETWTARGFVQELYNQALSRGQIFPGERIEIIEDKHCS